MIRWVFDQSLCVGPALWFNGYKWQNPHNREVPTIKMSSDNRVKESSVSFYSYKADVNFKIAVALACLYWNEFDMKGFGCKNSPEKFNHALLVNKLVNTLIMRYFIFLKLKSVTFNGAFRK